MPLVRRIAAWTAVALAAGILVLFAMPSYRQGEASIAGKPAVDFPLTLAGKSERLSDLKGKVVVLNFWATWCPPCVDETPALNRLEKYIDSRGGMVLGVSVDEDGATYEKFLKDQSVLFPTYRDATKKSASDYGTSIFPKRTLSIATAKSPANSSANSNGTAPKCWPTSTPYWDRLKS